MKASRRPDRKNPALSETLSYSPVALAFGTSGLRGRVRDITHLEVSVSVRAFLTYLQNRAEISPGDAVFLAGDLRPSTDAILQGVVYGIRAAGFTAGYLGKIPSPALAFYSMARRAAGVMVTGSHIPFDRNGVKFNAPSGEVLKADEGPILSLMKRFREEEYGRPAAESPFDARGMLKQSLCPELPPVMEEAKREYMARYTRAFPPNALAGARIMVWQHSAVGRDILVEILRALGAEVVPAGRSDTFIAVDTEAFGGEMMGEVRKLVDECGMPGLHAVVSTDGDGDRPLLLAVEEGVIRFFPGDLLGAVAADFLQAREAAIPISANDAVAAHLVSRGAAVARTKIGSPYIIAAMREVGWEANGGFLTAVPMKLPGGGVLDPLPTRDSILPLLAALSVSIGKGESISEVFSRLPRRFGKSGILRDFPRERADRITALLTPEERAITEVRFAGSAFEAAGGGKGAGPIAAGDPVFRDLFRIRSLIESRFSTRDGFPAVSWINWLDGVRIGFANGDVAHVRPSGNAPELRLYANADTPERAERIVSLAVSDNGILRRLDAESDEEIAARAFQSEPRPFPLKATAQNYDWGGFRVIPSLLGVDNEARKPFAELWMGAHPKSPSIAELPSDAGNAVPVPLDRLISRVPGTVLGADAVRMFGGKLPYLFKVLDARCMLSIQAHPSKAQAEEGFARENEAGIPPSSPRRGYADDNHKPEAHVALSDFWMLHGFRPLEEIAVIFGVETGGGSEPPTRAPELGTVIPEFAARLGKAGKEDAERRALLRELYARIMTMPQEDVDRALDPLADRLSNAPPMDMESPDFWALEAFRRHPRGGGGRDRGIFSIYMLNLLHLRPGQGTFQAAGRLHAYLRGTNVEIMANSDNVLRGGLTTKHVDAAELLEILVFDSGAPEILEGKPVSETERLYPVPAREFTLSRIEAVPGTPHRVDGGHGADCLLAVEGKGELAAGKADLPLRRGSVVLVPAGIPYLVEAEGGPIVIYKAGVPRGDSHS
jgi:phosphomannomutase